jgi:hypothetical protein
MRNLRRVSNVRLHQFTVTKKPPDFASHSLGRPPLRDAAVGRDFNARF